MAQATWTPQQLVRLRENLTSYFKEDELRTLCFDLQKLCVDLKGLDYDSLGGEGKAGKVRELVTYIDHRSCISVLVEKCRKERPNVDWGIPPKLPLLPPVPTQVVLQKQIIIALIVAGIVCATCLGYYGVKWLAEIPTRATQTAEARLTMVALSVTPAPHATVAPSPTGTFTPTPTPTPTPATVRLDSLAVAEGWMSGGDQANPARYISTRPCEGHYPGSGCMQWTFQTGGGWAGVQWWSPGCKSETLNTCGINLLVKAGFSTVNRLTFWAKGEKGGEVIEFKGGGRQIENGKATLKSTWEMYSIDLRGLVFTNLGDMFFWSASDIDNPTGASFYLDDIRFEGTK